MPAAIAEVQRDFEERGLAVLAIDIQEARETVVGWVQRSRVTVPVLLDADGRVARLYEVTATPTTFLVARDGTLVGKALGNRPWASARGRALLEALLRT